MILYSILYTFTSGTLVTNCIGVTIVLYIQYFAAVNGLVMQCHLFCVQM